MPLLARWERYVVAGLFAMVAVAVLALVVLTSGPFSDVIFRHVGGNEQCLQRLAALPSSSAACL